MFITNCYFRTYDTLDFFLYAFVKHRFHISDMLLKDIKSSFAFDFEHFLTTNDRMSSNTAIKYVRIFKRVIKMAVDQEWITGLNTVDSIVYCC